MADTFPPDGPTSLTKTLPSYLYQQYQDDDDLQAFVAAYNTLTQSYVDWFNNTPLPIYTNEAIAGFLLDWVATGLYGLPRPALPSGRNQYLGPLNTFGLNVLGPNMQRRVGPANFYATNDDAYRRILTWHFLKGDGKYFDIRWLKRRIMRFLVGENGTAPNIDNTYQISITFGVDNQVNIRILSGLRTLTGGPLNTMQLNTIGPNQITSTFIQFAPLEYAPVFKAAVDSGVLELPFQFTYVVDIN